MLEVKNIQTGFIFNLSDNTAENLVKKEPYNFQIVTKGYKPKEEKVEETTTYQKVVVEQPKKETDKKDKKEKTDKKKTDKK